MFEISYEEKREAQRVTTKRLDVRDWAQSLLWGCESSAGAVVNLICALFLRIERAEARIAELEAQLNRSGNG